MEPFLGSLLRNPILIIKAPIQSEAKHGPGLSHGHLLLLGTLSQRHEVTAMVRLADHVVEPGGLGLTVLGF